MGHLKSMSCITNALLINNVLIPEDLEKVKAHLTSTDYLTYPLGEGVDMYVCDIPPSIKEFILDVVQGVTRKKLEAVATFARYNSPDMDTSFRIHSDGLINGEQPDVACVLYLTTGNNGTALFTHEKYGDFPEEGEEKIHTEDDGLWQMYDYCEEVENTMFVYDAKCFHSRWPSKADNHRFVIVGFFKEV